ncbi:unnamed protein product [Symbiodinium microadriaticum]|nr:unnamed protein product [Symbiodinium microadriaticum]CAE7948764.1 unnamed protein product [Symbiodinium sp. KB8]
MKLSGSLVGLIAQQLTPLAAMGGFVAKGKGGPGKDEGPKSLKADMMEDEAEDSEDEEHQMEKDALRAMEVGGRESLAAAYEAMAAKEVVYDTFSDELRAGYIARVQAREAWHPGCKMMQGHLELTFESLQRVGGVPMSAVSVKALGR